MLGATLPYNDLKTLHARIATEWPHLGVAGLSAVPFVAPTGGGVLGSGPIALPVANFYLTNAIARASQTMADCVTEILGHGVQLEAAE